MLSQHLTVDARDTLEEMRCLDATALGAGGSVTLPGRLVKLRRFHELAECTLQQIIPAENQALQAG